MGNLGNLVFSYCFDGAGKALPVMEHYGFDLCSVRDIAELKITQTMEDRRGRSGIFDNGPILTRDAVLCFPGDPPKAKFIKFSPLLLPSSTYFPDKRIVISPARIADEKDVIGSTFDEIYDSILKELEKTNFFPSEEQIACSLERSVEFPIKEKDSWGEFVELKDFKKNELISFILGGEIDMYKKSLEMSNIKGVRIYPEVSESINKFDRPFVKQIIYGRDETAEVSIHSLILFATRPFCIYGLIK